MLSGFYSAASGLDVAETRHRVASENLAHIHQPGFRRRLIEQKTFQNELEQITDPQEYAITLGATTSDTEIKLDFTPGPLEQSQRPLDVAIQGENTFFNIEGPDGVLYTRSGRFHVNGEGQLVTVDNLPVIGQGGPITITGGEEAVHNLHIDQSGRIYVNSLEVGQLELTKFESPQELVTAGASLFEDNGAAEAGTPDAGDFQVLQGFVERSNVSSIDELVNIVVASRQYEAAKRALTSLDQSIQSRIGLNR